MMLREPRGYPAVCAATLSFPPAIRKPMPDSSSWSRPNIPQCPGGNTISVATVLLETGILPMHEPVTELTLESPAGLIRIKADCINGKVINVTFENVPAFAVHLDAEIDVKGLGKVTVDVSWGGMFYVIADAGQFDGLDTGCSKRSTDYEHLFSADRGCCRAIAGGASGESRI